MKYVVATGLASPSSIEAVDLLEKSVEDELKQGAQLVGGVSFIFVPGAGYQGFQSLVYPSPVQKETEIENQP
jgi:hypothetical protein